MLSETKLQSPRDTVLSQIQFELKQEQFKFQFIRFMHNDRGNMDSKKFTLEKRKKSKYLQENTEAEIHYFIKHSKSFNEDNEGNVVYVKNKT